MFQSHAVSLPHLLHRVCKVYSHFLPKKLFIIRIHSFVHTRDVHECKCRIQACHEAYIITAKVKCIVSPLRVHFPQHCAVCSQQTDGVSKLVRVYDAAATEWTANCLCCSGCLCCGRLVVFFVWSGTFNFSSHFLYFKALVVSFLESFVPRFLFTFDLLCKAM